MYVVCPKCERKIRNPNQWHNCVRVNVDDLFKGKADDLILIFDALLAEIADWEGVDVSASKNCVIFLHRQTFLIIRPMKTLLDLKFFSDREYPAEPPILKSIFYSGRYQSQIRLASLEEVTQELFAFIKKSYQLL